MLPITDTYLSSPVKIPDRCIQTSHLLLYCTHVLDFEFGFLAEGLATSDQALGRRVPGDDSVGGNGVGLELEGELVTSLPHQVTQSAERDIIATHHVLERVVEHSGNPHFEQKLLPVVVAFLEMVQEFEVGARPGVLIREAPAGPLDGVEQAFDER
jgi:hypothetical protein